MRRLAGEDVKIPFHYLPEFAQRPLARVRELHVYGSLKMVTKAHATTGTNSQHTGVVMPRALLLFHGRFLGFGNRMDFTLNVCFIGCSVT